MSSESDGEPSGTSLSYRNIIEREMESALQEINRPPKGVFLSGFSAGLNLSFGALLMAMASTFLGNIIGGSVFVGLINYGQIALVREKHDIDFEATDHDE